MALRQFTSKCGKPIWSYLSVVKAGHIIPPNDSSSRLVQSVSKGASSSIKQRKITPTSLLNCKNVSSVQNTGFVDFVTYNFHKKLYMPTNTVNTLKVYQDINLNPVLIEDNLNKIQIIDPPAPEGIVKKEAVRMIRIRRRKMRKHKLQKLRKRMKFVFEKIKMKRDLRKEQDFRSELLTQVEAADKFDAKEYVEKIMHTLRYHPKPKTLQDILEEKRELKKINRYNTSFIRPKFE